MTTNDSKYTIVIMSVHNEERFLGQTLDQIYLQDFPMDKIEIIVADGLLTDNSGIGPTTGRNLGAMYS